jgi:hypothetical protein
VLVVGRGVGNIPQFRRQAGPVRRGKTPNSSSDSGTERWRLSRLLSFGMIVMAYGNVYVEMSLMKGGWIEAAEQESSPQLHGFRAAHSVLQTQIR